MRKPTQAETIKALRRWASHIVEQVGRIVASLLP